MYVIPLVLLFIAALAIGLWAPPIFAALVAVPFVVLFFAWIGSRRRPDETPAEATAGQPADAPQQERAPERGGVWGERESSA